MTYPAMTRRKALVGVLASAPALALVPDNAPADSLDRSDLELLALGAVLESNVPRYLELDRAWYVVGFYARALGEHRAGFVGKQHPTHDDWLAFEACQRQCEAETRAPDLSRAYERAAREIEPAAMRALSMQARTRAGFAVQVWAALYAFSGVLIDDGTEAEFDTETARAFLRCACLFAGIEQPAVVRLDIPDISDEGTARVRAIADAALGGAA